MIVHEAQAVRVESTVVVFEGIVEHEHGVDVVWFGVDHREAANVAQAADDGLALLVEPWQVIARTEQNGRTGSGGAPPRRGVVDGPWEHPSLGEPDGPAWLDRI